MIDRPTPGPRAAFWVVTVLVGLLGTVWAFASPLMSLPDETAHTSRAVSVARGQVVGEPDELTMADDGLVGRVTNVQLPAAFGEVRLLMGCYAQRGVPADCAEDLPDVEGTVTRYTSVGTYPPVFYGLVGWPHHLLAPQPSLYAMRVVAAWLVAPLAGLAFAALRRLGTHPVLLLGGAVGLTPVVLFLVGGINPSGLEIVAALALWATTAVVVSHGVDGARPLAAWAVAAVALAWSRPLGPLFVLGIVAVTAVAVGDHEVLAARWRSSRDRRVAAGVGVAWLAAWAWLLAFGTLGAFKGIPDPSLTPGVAARRSLAMTAERLEQVVAVFGWVDTPAPTVTTFWPWMLVAGAVVVAGLVRGTWRLRAALVLLGAVAVVLPVLAEMGRAAEIGLGWQGRYTMPVLVGLPVLAAIGTVRGQRTRRPVDETKSAPRVVSSVALGTAFAVLAGGALLAVAHLVGFAAALRRYTVGIDDPRPFWAFLAVDGWAPPGGATLLLVLVACLLAAAGGALAMATWRARARPRDGGGRLAFDTSRRSPHEDPADVR